MAKEEEGKISPAVIVPLAGVLGLAALAGLALVRAEPPEEEPPTVYTCPTCGAQFSKEAELLTHIASEHPPVVYYTCPTCGAQFAIESDLITHIETEHPEAPPVIYYTCSVCGETFISQAELDTHAAAEHPPVIYYTCSACGATFVSQTELDTHTISEHPEPEPEPPPWEPPPLPPGYVKTSYGWDIIYPWGIATVEINYDFIRITPAGVSPGAPGTSYWERGTWGYDAYYAMYAAWEDDIFIPIKTWRAMVQQPDNPALDKYRHYNPGTWDGVSY